MQRTRAGAPPAGRPTTGADRVREAAAKARQRAKEQQAKQFGQAPFIIWGGKRAEPKGGETTLWSMIPYLVTEKHHPDGAQPGELWYKRPYMIHRNLGPEELTKVCPKSFNPRAMCAVHNHLVELRKDWDANADLIKSINASNREVYLIYDHDSKEVLLYDAAYGSVKNPGFGYLLASRIENPLAEEWAAFWLDGEDGMGLRITWQSSDFAGGGSWVRPISIDFVERKKAPVPKEIWGKAVELSTVLEKTSSEDIEAIHHGYGEVSEASKAGGDDYGTASQPATKENLGTPQSPPEETSQTPPPAEEPNWGLMDKASLLSYARSVLEIEPRAVRAMGSLPVEKLREDLATKWWQKENGDMPEPTDDAPPFETDSASACPFGHQFGVDFGNQPQCSQDCPDERYNACGDENDKLNAK